MLTLMPTYIQDDSFDLFLLHYTRLGYIRQYAHFTINLAYNLFDKTLIPIVKYTL